MNCFLLKIIASLMLLSLTCLANPNGNSHAPSPLAKKLGLQHGDLIFIKTSESAFDKAISQATQKDEVSYTHIGIFDLHLDSVLEAEPKQGVVRKKLEIFLKENPLFDIMRLTPKVAKNVDIQASIKRAEKHLGEPYDFTYTANNGAMYCSELVYEAFLDTKGRHIFSAKPMNFYAPDGSLPQYWEELFKKLQKPIPQGELGTNPNDMARDKVLMRVNKS
ncbi:hypothetical protein LS74_002345 [Helicobacter magdeburgensis]|uniref:Permuted papain-like amidase YaeF/Yiix C92 family enzyme n=1 Tax=Helicobacter magdeburgensis TaxID=471858 RepID=A0A4U8T2L5_9HELI|nr:YiiX/YebB-like N1pC/P60 family cysteine hydrolase [Helicobacter magdeburgensis]TLD93574.1 hypothetical protein LS74_002345 [Helicobacter magdeburgensis]